MKRIFLLVALIANISFVASAASVSSSINNNGREVKGKKTDYSTLNLTEKQQTEIKTLNDEFNQKLEQIKNNSTLSKEEARSKRKELRTEKQNKINSILSAEQKEILKEQRGKRNKNTSSKGRKGKKDGISRMNKRNPFEKLNLSEGQKAELDKINENYAKQLKSLRSEQDSAISNILTAEQKEVLKSEKEKSRHNKFDSKDKKRKGCKNLDDATTQKLSALKENYEKDKKAIELSRIAPDIQKQQIEELNKKYRNEKRELLKETRSNCQKQKA